MDIYFAIISLDTVRNICMFSTELSKYKQMDSDSGMVAEKRPYTFPLFGHYKYLFAQLFLLEMT